MTEIGEEIIRKTSDMQHRFTEMDQGERIMKKQEWTALCVTLYKFEGEITTNISDIYMYSLLLVLACA